MSKPTIETQPSPKAQSLVATITQPHAELDTVLTGCVTHRLAEYDELSSAYYNLLKDPNSNPSERQGKLSELLHGIADAAAAFDHLTKKGKTPQTPQDSTIDMARFVYQMSFELTTYADTGVDQVHGNEAFIEDISHVLSNPENTKLVLDLFDSHIGQILYPKDSYDQVEYRAGILLETALSSPLYPGVISAIEQNLESQPVSEDARKNLAHICSICIIRLLDKASLPETDLQISSLLAAQIASLDSLLPESLQFSPEETSDFAYSEFYVADLAFLIEKLTPSNKTVNIELLRTISSVFCRARDRFEKNKGGPCFPFPPPSHTTEYLANTQNHLLLVAANPQVDGPTTAELLRCYTQLDKASILEKLRSRRQEPLTSNEALQNLAIALAKTPDKDGSTTHIAIKIAQQIREIDIDHIDPNQSHHAALLGELWVLVQPNSIPNPQTLEALNLYFQRLPNQLSTSHRSFSPLLIENLAITIRKLGCSAIEKLSSGIPLDESQLFNTLATTLIALKKVRQGLDADAAFPDPEQESPSLVLRHEQIAKLIETTKLQLASAACFTPLPTRKLAILALAQCDENATSLINGISFWSAREQLVFQILSNGGSLSLLDKIKIPNEARIRIARKILKLYQAR